MICPNCQQPLETGAAFCGNCGQAVNAAAQTSQPAQVTGPQAAQSQPAIPPPAPAQSAPPTSPIVQVLQNQATVPAAAPPAGPLATATPTGVPSYALAVPGQHSAENKALMALLFGIAGIIGALFMALLGLAFGTVGIAMGTMSRKGSKRALSTAGMVVSCIAVLVSLGVWIYADKHYAQVSQNPSGQTHGAAAPAVSESNLSTPCYSAVFTSKLNVSNSSGSCDMVAYNGTTPDSSSEVYKVYAATSATVNATNFASAFKPALEKDVKDNLPNFTVDGEKQTQFAGSPAYSINASNKSEYVAVTEEAVLHQTGNGENVFIFVHAINANSTDLKSLESQWQWK